MRKPAICLLTAIFLMASIIATAQTIRGRVVESEKNTPLSGASVRAIGTNVGTSTDADGRFSISVSQDGQLEVSYIGYETQKVSVNNQTELLISLISSSSILSDVIVSTGSRASARTLTTTPLPVDVFSTNDLKSTGQPSFDKALQYRVPSFNTVNTPVNDAGSLLDPYEIRNMGPSRTLVLINGKRKNSSSLVYIQQGPGVGESGVDISAIPTDAIKRVEILRDGASAQYGSDAIAGVMNIILKDNAEGGSVTLNGSTTHKGDGELLGVSLNNASPLGNRGFLNYTINFQQQQQANRPGKVDAEGEASAFGADINDVKAFLALKPDAGNINGQPKTTAAQFLMNGKVATSDISEIYFNAAYVYKKVNSYANYRTPYWRTTDYGLLTPPGQPYLGYVPTFDGDLNDYNGTLGFKRDNNGWKTDLSLTVGGNQQLYTVRNSLNRSLAFVDPDLSPTLFHAGGYSFKHVVGNIDITKVISDQLSIGMGSEFRSETYELIEGDPASYDGSGADSFAGIAKDNATKNNRYNFGGYFDLSYDVTKDFLLNGTARVENYSDFGNAFVWKISSRYKLAQDKVTLRSSISTGFRAPSLHQIYNQIDQYGFSSGQVLVQKVLNNVGKEAFQLGLPKLKAEKSVNFTAGIGVAPRKNISLTFDFYSIEVDHRIVFSPQISGGGNPDFTVDKILAGSGAVSLQFWANALKTRTSGLDFVGNVRDIRLGNGKAGINLAGNYTLTNKQVGKTADPASIVQVGQSVINGTLSYLLFKSRPKYKVILGGDYKIGKFGFTLNNTLFGPTEFQDLAAPLDPSLKIKFDPKVVTDLSASVELFSKLTFTAYVNNILNVLPEWKLVALDAKGETILKDPAQVKSNINNITFDGRYSIQTYNGSHFSQLGTIFGASATFKF